MKTLRCWMLSLVFFGGLAAAADLAVTLNIDAQPLDKALSEFAQQTGLQVIFRTDEVAPQLISPPLAGKFSAEDALKKLLANSGLGFKYLNPRTIAVRPMDGGQKASQAADGKTLTLVQSDTPSPSIREQNRPEAPKTESSKGVPEILVKGSRVLNMDLQRSADDPQPYVIFERATIERSGATNLEEFLKQRLTMNSQAQTNSQSATALFGNTSSINLRGLGTNQTLILIDGHRAPSILTVDGPKQADINGLPLDAIERIEVLPTTASGIHGGSATGGVVNIILRRDYSGTQIKLTYDNSFHSDSARRRADVSAGFSFEGGKTNVMLAGSFADANGLEQRERDFIARGRVRMQANNPGTATLFGATPPLGATTNIRSQTGAPLTLKPAFGGTNLNSAFTYIPYGYSGAASDNGAALVANAGRYNLDLANSAQAGGGGLQGLISTPTVKSFTATLRRQMTESVQGFLDASRSENDGVVTSNAVAGNYTLAATAANNPFVQAINVTVPITGEGVNTVRKVETSSDRLVGGVIFRLPGQWQMETDYTWNRASYQFVSPPTLLAAGTSGITSGTLNVMRDVNIFPIDYTPYLNSTYTSKIDSTIGDASVRASGPVMRTRAGAVTLSGLLEHRRESFGDAYQFSPAISNVSYFPSKEQTVQSAYLESIIPLVSKAQKIPGIYELQLQLAGRFDRYEVQSAPSSAVPGNPVTRITKSNDSTNPTVAVSYRPISDVLVRMSYGTGFLPPSVQDLATLSALLPFPPGFFQDPLRGNQLTGGVNGISGGNADLGPEKSESISAGVVLTPKLVEGLRVSLDYTRIDKTDNIFNPFALLTSDFRTFSTLFPGRVIRDTNPATFGAFGVGPITAIDATLLNISSARIEAYDAAVDYQRDIGAFGSVDFILGATWQTHYLTQATPDQPFVENAGTTNSFPLKFKANGGVTWKHGAWTVSWNSQYFDSYRVSLSNTVTIANQGNGGRVPHQIYHDASVSYDFANRENRMLNRTKLQLGVHNVFDTTPPFDAGSVLLYSSFADPRMASYQLSIVKGF